MQEQDPAASLDKIGKPVAGDDHPIHRGLRFLTTTDQELSQEQEVLRSLALLSLGYDHRMPNTYRRLLRTSLQNFKAALPGEDGDQRTELDIIQHSLLALALAEAQAMTGDPALREPVRRALSQLLSQAQRGGPDGRPWLAWSAPGQPAGRSCLRSTFFASLALKTALMGGSFDDYTPLTEVANWLRASQALAGASRFPAWVQLADGEASAQSANHLGLALGALAGLTLPELEDMQERLTDAQDLPLADLLANSEHLFATAMSYAAIGRPEAWKRWFEEVLPALYAQQDADGSWPGIPNGPDEDSFTRSTWIILAIAHGPRYRYAPPPTPSPSEP